jgi:AcrR family transcriptional regulator
MPNTPGPNSRERLLSAAQQMLRESGMAGTGIKDVVARSGAPIGSLYHFFPGGKSQLVTESVRLQGDKLRHALARDFATKRSPAASVRAFFDAVAEELDASRANAGCAVGAVALDLAPTDTEIRAECREAFDAWSATIAPHLPFRDERSRQSFATMIVLSIEGAFVLSRAARNGDAFRHAGKWLSAMLSAADQERAARR